MKEDLLHEEKTREERAPKGRGSKEAAREKEPASDVVSRARSTAPQVAPATAAVAGASAEAREAREQKEPREERPEKLKETREERPEKRELRDEKEEMLRALKMLAPGAPLREGLESILRAKMGALIVLGDSPEILELVEGGFQIDTEFTPPNIYELAKMDGAIILSQDAQRILYANTQLVPDPLIPSEETGIRHRTAQRFACQTGTIVIAISHRRGLITLYKGASRYIFKEIGVILSKANQAIQTLERYKRVLDKALVNLTALEFEELVTVFDVAKVVQRGEMVLRIVRELEGYIIELGVEGRLVTMQAEELVANVEDELFYVIQDYHATSDKSVSEIKQYLGNSSSEELLELSNFSRALGYGAASGILDLAVFPRGYRILHKIPKLPTLIIENLVQAFVRLQNIVKASIEELDTVEGIGEARARAIKNGMRRLQEQVMLDRYM
ncbi:MAG: DNA integrity scanning diadenylate cyclase DisA [Thermacetogeniaceae bacterium]